MILLLGASGYVGTAFRKALQEANQEWQPVSRKETHIYDRSALRDRIRSSGADFLINCAGYTGKPNVDACEAHKADTLQGNAVLPGILREVCEDEGLAWGQVSSGCVYTGRRADGAGFTEEDPANFSFRSPPCSFYSGSKALGEEVLEGAEQCYIWRMRIPFDEVDSPRNYLSKIMRYAKLLEAENSISHLDEFVGACLECRRREIDYGLYNVTNPGVVTTSQVVEWIQEELHPSKTFEFFKSEEAFMAAAAHTPRSNCVLDSSKLAATGIHMTPVEEAVRTALRQGDWTESLRI
jgi:UDP-glucose 4,6-dehydratase